MRGLGGHPVKHGGRRREGEVTGRGEREGQTVITISSLPLNSRTVIHLTKCTSSSTHSQTFGLHIYMYAGIYMYMYVGCSICALFCFRVTVIMFP